MQDGNTQDGDPKAAAERFAALFRALYLTYHRRDGPRSELPGRPARSSPTWP